MNSPQFATRKPTGKASFPLILLAGVEGSGKTWAAVESTGMEQVDRAFFLEIGEGMADEYGSVPGADFEIISHDGTVQQIRQALAWAGQQPAADGKFNMLIVDSMSEVWSLLSDNAQAEADRRVKRKGRNVPEGGAQITMDLWNRATDTWEGMIRQMHAFPGPVILTARLDVVTLMDNDGKPTKDKDWKIQAQKRLPYRVTVLMQARQPRVWTMTKIATTVPALQLDPGKAMTFNDFSVPKLLEKMGVTAGMESSTFQSPVVDESLSDEAQAAAEVAAQQAQEREQQEQAAAARRDQVSRFGDDLLAAEKSGDLSMVNQMGKSVYEAGDSELTMMTKQVQQRMMASQQPAPPVVEGEVMPNG